MSIASHIQAGIRRRSRKPLLARIALYACAIISLIILLSPIVWIVSTAIKRPEDVFRIPPMLIPPEISWDGIIGAMNEDVLNFFINSVIVGLGTAVATCFAGSLTAYGISRVKFRASQGLMMFFLASLGFPIPLLMISIYTMYVKSGMLDTYGALILAHTILTLPIVIWIMKDFFDTSPVEIEESAYVDGAGPIYTLIHVVFPMVKAPLVASGIFVFVTSWNEFIFGLTFISSRDMRPMPAGIAMVYLQEMDYAWPELMAVVIVVTIPILLLFLLFQRYFIEGVTAGAVKG